MAQYIDKDALVEYINFRYLKHQTGNQPIGCLDKMNEDKEILSYLNTLEVKEVDLEKLGEIARHLIAVKEHIEDMRLDKEEWFMFEKIGYPERFKTQKGE